MDGLFSGQFDSLLQSNKEQSESSIVSSNVICPCINSRPECIIVKLDYDIPWYNTSNFTCMQ